MQSGCAGLFDITSCTSTKQWALEKKFAPVLVARNRVMLSGSQKSLIAKAFHLWLSFVVLSQVCCECSE